MILVCAGNPKKAQGIVTGDPYLKSWTVSLLLLMDSVCTGEKHEAQMKSFRYIWDERTGYGRGQIQVTPVLNMEEVKEAVSKDSNTLTSWRTYPVPLSPRC